MKKDAFKLNIAKMIKESGKSTRAVALEAGVDYRWLWRMTKQGIAKPTTRHKANLERIAKFFGLNMEELWGGYFGVYDSLRAALASPFVLESEKKVLVKVINHLASKRTMYSGRLCDNIPESIYQIRMRSTIEELSSLLESNSMFEWHYDNICDAVDTAIEKVKVSEF